MELIYLDVLIRIFQRPLIEDFYMYLNRFILFVSFLFLVSCGGGSGDEKTNLEKTELTIISTTENWGTVQPIDAKAVALSAGEEVLKNIPGIDLDPIILKNKIADTPITLYERGANGEYIIGVTIDDTYWAQLAYQFSHELMHVITNYGNTRGDANQWFEEAVCEAASIQAVREMSKSWKTNPPYPNWKSYSENLANYYADLITENSRYLASGDSMASWYQREKESLRSHATQRDKNEVVGTRIYHYFNESPDRWRSLKYLSIGDFDEGDSLEKYLNEWEKQLPEDLKYVAITISSWFGF